MNLPEINSSSSFYWFGEIFVEFGVKNHIFLPKMMRVKVLSTSINFQVENHFMFRREYSST